MTRTKLAALTAGLTLGLTGAAQAEPIDPVPLGGVNYGITAHTGNINNAGTDGDVDIKLYGTKGTTPWVPLDNAEDNWERNKTDQFTRRLADIGTIRTTCVRFTRGNGDYGDWYLDWFDVNDRFAQFYMWLDRDMTVCKPAT
jgi:hypothetical protein